MNPIKLLALCAVLAFTGAAQSASPAASPGIEQAFQEKVVYHITDSAVARMALRNAENHLQASPGVKIVFVAHGKGIDFLLNDAKDEKGAYEPQVAGLRDRGVTFDVCRNTLKSRKLNDGAVIMEAQVVPAGVAEIARLQAREGYVYLKP